MSHLFDAVRGSALVEGESLVVALKRYFGELPPKEHWDPEVRERRRRDLEWQEQILEEIRKEKANGT